MADQISEHAVGTDESRQDSKQSPQEKQIGEVVEELLQRSKRSSAGQRKKWPDRYDFVFGGRQWNIDRPSWRFSESVNLSASTILTEVGVQTDSRPKVEYTAEEPTDIEFAELLKSMEDANWVKPGTRGFGWQTKLLEHIMDVKYADISWCEIPWDPTMEDGIGDVGWNVFDPEYCFWDPLAKTLKDMRWFIYLQPTPTSQLKLEYPEKSHAIQSDIHTVGEKGGLDLDHNVDRYWRGAFQGQDYESRYQREDRYGGEPMSLKVRAWIRDTAVEEVEEEKKNEHGEMEKVFVQRLKFPKGRYVCMQGKTVLEDRHNGAVINGKVHPYDDGLFPVAALVNYKLPRRLDGLSEIPFVRGPQKVVNYLWSFGLDHLKMAGNPKVTATRAAHDVVDKITNEPGAVFEVPTQDALQFHPGEGMPPGYFNMLEKGEGLFDKVQGLGEVSRGTPDPSVTSGLQFDSYVEAAQTRPRLKNRNVDEFLRQIGHLRASRYLQFYTSRRVFRLTNKDGSEEFVEFSISENEGVRMGNVKRTKMKGKEVLETGQSQIDLTGKGIPDIRIESGSALPFARSQKNAVAQTAFTSNAIDRTEYLKAIEWPNWEAVAKRMDEKEALMAEAQGGQGNPAA